MLSISFYGQISLASSTTTYPRLTEVLLQHLNTQQKIVRVERYEIQWMPTSTTVLPPCEQLTVASPSPERLIGKTSVTFRCLNSGQATNATPSARTPSNTFTVNADIQWLCPTLVTTSAIGMNRTLREEEVSMTSQSFNQFPSAIIQSFNQLDGQETSRALPINMILKTDFFKSTPLIRAGSMVTILISGAGFNISSEGKALHSAGLGHPLKVQIENNKIVSGIVKDANTIEIRY